jgi:hypothetical protein
MDAADIHMIRQRHDTEEKEVDDEPTCHSPLDATETATIRLQYHDDMEEEIDKKSTE